MKLHDLYAREEYSRVGMEDYLSRYELTEKAVEHCAKGHACSTCMYRIGFYDGSLPPVCVITPKTERKEFKER